MKKHSKIISPLIALSITAIVNSYGVHKQESVFTFIQKGKISKQYHDKFLTNQSKRGIDTFTKKHLIKIVQDKKLKRIFKVFFPISEKWRLIDYYTHTMKQCEHKKYPRTSSYIKLKIAFDGLINDFPLSTKILLTNPLHRSNLSLIIKRAQTFSYKKQNVKQKHIKQIILLLQLLTSHKNFILIAAATHALYNNRLKPFKKIIEGENFTSTIISLERLIDEYLNTPVHIASSLKSPDILDYLLKNHNLNPNQKNLKGSTPLIIATENLLTNTINLLLKSPKLDVLAKDASNRTALDHIKIKININLYNKKRQRTTTYACFQDLTLKTPLTIRDTMPNKLNPDPELIAIYNKLKYYPWTFSKNPLYCLKK